MVVNCDVQRINQVLQDYFNATGINTFLLKEDFTFVGNHNFWEKKHYRKTIQGTKKARKLVYAPMQNYFTKVVKAIKWKHVSATPNSLMFPFLFCIMCQLKLLPKRSALQVDHIFPRYLRKKQEPHLLSSNYKARSEDITACFA